MLISLVMSPLVVKIKLPLPLLKNVSLIQNKSVNVKKFLLALIIVHLNFLAYANFQPSEML